MSIAISSCSLCDWLTIFHPNISEMHTEIDQILFLLGQFCDVTKVVMIQQEDFTKFGYKQNMKVKICRHPFIVFLLPTSTKCVEI
jgi:hypothetical protein